MRALVLWFTKESAATFFRGLSHSQSNGNISLNFTQAHNARIYLKSGGYIIYPLSSLAKVQFASLRNALRSLTTPALRTKAWTYKFASRNAHKPRVVAYLLTGEARHL